MYVAAVEQDLTTETYHAMHESMHRMRGMTMSSNTNAHPLPRKLGSCQANPEQGACQD